MICVGIDLGGTNIAAGVVNETYQVLAKESIPTRVPRPVEEICNDMAAVCRKALRKAGVSAQEVAWYGIGSPGVANPVTGEVEYANNLAFHHAPVGPLMEKLAGKQVYLDNDANAAAYGEMLAGAGKGVQSCVAVTLGTGVGGGVILNGKIFSGSNFAGGELGHTVLVQGGEPCTCGRLGCWEAYASATALIRQTRLAMEQHPDSVMWQLAGTLDQVNGKTAFDAMRMGDPSGKAVVDAYIGYVASGVTNIINIFQPEVLCIGGGVSKEGETLLAPIRKIVEQERYSKYSKKQTKICAAQLGNDAGIIGAAFLEKQCNHDRKEGNVVHGAV